MYKLEEYTLILLAEKNQLKYNEVCALNSLLKYAQTAYKNVGTDNNLVILYPYLEKDEKTKQQYADIEVCFMNKNAEEARRAILNNKHRLYKEYGDSVKKDLQALADRDETAMKKPYCSIQMVFYKRQRKRLG